MTDKLNNLKDDVLRKIRSHEVAMRPRMYFTLRVIALVVLTLMVFLLTLFLCNFILFIVRVNHHDALLGMGPRGFFAFVNIFPWGLFLLDIALLLVLERLLRQFSFGYRTPVLLSLLVAVILIVAAALAIDRESGLNDELLRRADHHGLPSPFGEFYENAHRPVPREYEVIEIKAPEPVY